MPDKRGGRTRGHRVRRLVAALTAFVALGVFLPASPASASISLGLPIVGDLLSGVTGSGLFDWGTTSAPVLHTVQLSKIIGAGSTAASGLDGTGVGVALVDTGVVPVAGLPASHVVNGPDLSFESQAPGLRYLDTYGHGTHLAGIIAGNDPTTGLRGVAPGVMLTSVKVGTARGTVDASQVIAALDWVVAHRNDDPAHPIRVVNLAYGTDGTQDSKLDPLSFAVENAWRAGLVVVVAGGNAGEDRDRLDNPATNRFVLSVGSASTQGTTATDDDYISDFDSVSSGRNVDLVAPGESIVSLRNPGSYIDTTYPDGRVDATRFRGSGSSQATAVVSGAVALLLQKRPTLNPDQVKALLKNTATWVPDSYGYDSGVGELNLAAALTKATPTTLQKPTVGTGLGTLDKARGSHRVVFNDVALTGEADIFGPFSTAQWATASASGTAWVGGQWMGRTMAGDGWTGTSWAVRTWAPATWTSGYWGATWSDSTWSSHTWSGTYWSGTYWSGTYWSSSTW